MGAYIVPIIQNILDMKNKSDGTEQITTTLILAPSKELCQQIKATFDDLKVECPFDICALDLASMTNLNIVKYVQTKQPDVIIATPPTILAKMHSGVIELDALKTLIVDDAELIFSFGYEDTVHELFKCIPTKYQSIHFMNAPVKDKLARIRELQYELKKKPSLLPLPPLKYCGRVNTRT